MRKSCVAYLLLAGIVPASVHAQDPRATANPNPCAALQTQLRDYRAPAGAPIQRIKGRPFLYNGVDDIVAPLDRPLRLSPDFVGDFKSSCVVFEVAFDGRGGLAHNTPLVVWPPIRNDMIASREQAGAEVLRQIPFDRVLRQVPGAGLRHLVAVPLWPKHPFYTNAGDRVAAALSNDLGELGYGGSFERIAQDKDVSIYKVQDIQQGGTLTLKFVVLRDIGESDAILSVRMEGSGGMQRPLPDGRVAEIFNRSIAPWTEKRAANSAFPVSSINVEVRHHARSFRIPYESRDRDSSAFPFATDPASGKPVDSPLLQLTSGGSRRSGPIRWNHHVGIPRYATIADARKILAAEAMTPEQRRAAAEQKHAEEVAQQQKQDAEKDAIQAAARTRDDPGNPLASLGYQNGAPMLTAGRATYYLTESTAPGSSAKVRAVVAVHAIGANEPVVELVHVTDDNYRYADRRVAFVQQKLVPQALARWPDLRRVEIHHHVKGQQLPDTAEFRRMGPRAWGHNFDQPVFEEQYLLSSGSWRPLYELDQGRLPQVDLSLREYSRTASEARAFRAELEDGKRIANLSPEARQAELRQRRLALQAGRAPGYVYKSDRFWAELPRFGIPERVFAGDFSGVSLDAAFARHFTEFVTAYSSHCSKQVKATGDYTKYTITRRELTLDGYGNVKFHGPESVTEIYVEGRFVKKYEELGKVVELATAGQAIAMVMDGDGMAAMGAKILTTRPDQLLNDLIWGGSRPGGQSFEMMSGLVAVTYSWREFVGNRPCESATTHQMRENLLLAANGQRSLQSQGRRVANAAAETEPLVPSHGQRTLFDACYESQDYTKSDFCICMDMRGSKVMNTDQRQRYTQDFDKYFLEIVLAKKGGPADPRWRLYELLQQCPN